MKNQKIKISVYLFYGVWIWITILMVVESPNLGLEIYSNSSGQYQSLPKLNNGFVGSTLVFYSDSPIVNSTQSVIGYNITVTSYSFAGICIMFLTTLGIVSLIINDNKKIEKKRTKTKIEV